MGKLIADVGPAGGQDAGLHAHRQLGDRLAELDAPDARGIPEAARLRPAAAAAGDDRTRGRSAWKSPSASSGTCGRRSRICSWRTTPGISRDLAHQHGLRLSIEAYDGTPCDDMAYAGRADEPMGEFWSWGDDRRGLQLHGDVLGGPRLRQADPRGRGVHRHRRREMAGPSGFDQGRWATGPSAKASTASSSTATPCSPG